MSIGQRIAEARRNRKMTQDDLSRKSGVDYNTLIKIEGGKVEKPRRETLKKVAEALEITLDSLISATDDSPYKPQIQGRTILPFTQLSYERFEVLVFTVIDRLPEWNSAQQYAHMGDKGRDTIAKLNGEERFTFFQSKRYQNVEPADFTAELDKIKQHFFGKKKQKDQQPARIVFCVACGVKPTLRDALKEYANSNGLPDVEIWAEVELDSKCKAIPLIIKEFFGGYITEAIEDISKVHSLVQESAEKIREDIAKLPQQIQTSREMTDEQEDAELREATRLVNAGQFVEAEKIMNPLLAKLEEKKDTKKRHEVYNILGVRYSNDKEFADWKRARDYFEKALALQPTFEKAARNLAIAYLNSQDKEYFQKAEKLAKEKMKEFPDNLSFVSFYLLALDRLQNKKELSAFIASHPDLKNQARTDLDLRVAVGNAYLKIEDLGSALQIAEEGLQEFPNSCNLNLIKGRALLFKADKEERTDNIEIDVVMQFKDPSKIVEAQRCLEKALDAGIAEKQPRSFLDAIRLELLTSTHILGEYEKFGYIKRQIDFSKMNESVITQVEVRDFANFIRQRNFRAAFDILKSSKLFPKIVYIEVRKLAHIFLSKGAPEFAVELLLPFKQEAVKIEDEVYWFILTTAYALMGKKNEAITTTEEARRIFAKNPKKHKKTLEFASGLANRYIREGETDRLWESINELQRVEPDVPIIRPIKAVEDDGTLSKEIRDLFDRMRKEYNEKKQLFMEKHLPIYLLQKIFNKSFPEVINLPRGNADFDFTLPYTFVNEEFISGGKQMFEKEPQLILDYSALYNLAKAKSLGLLQMFSKKVIIHEQLFNEIQENLQVEEDEVVRAIWEFVRSQSVIHETRTIERKEVFSAKVRKIFPSWLIETIELAHQDNVLLVCDDLNLVKMLKGKPQKIINTFVIFQAAVAIGYLDKKQYALVLGALAEMFYAFLPFNGKDLLYIAIDDDDKMKSQQIRWGKYDRNDRVEISHRFFHLINQIHLPGSEVRSFVSTAFSFIEEVTRLGLLYADKAKYLYFLTAFFLYWIRENLPKGDKEELGIMASFIGKSWAMMITRTSGREDFVYLKEMAEGAFRKREGDDEAQTAITSPILAAVLKGIEERIKRLDEGKKS